MAKIFIEPEILDDELLMHWTYHFIKALDTAELAAMRARTHLNAYMAECQRRGLWHANSSDQ